MDSQRLNFQDLQIDVTVQNSSSLEVRSTLTDLNERAVPRELILCRAWRLRHLHIGRDDQ